MVLIALKKPANICLNIVVAHKLILTVPGSTSNLGAGFDTFALALGLYTRLTFTTLDHNDPSIPFISYSGRSRNNSRSSAFDQLTYQVLNRLWKGDSELLKLVRLQVESDVPLGAGLGGTAAILVGTVWAANYFQGRMPTQNEVLLEASAMEGHSETFAASSLGNFVVCGRSANGREFITRTLEWPLPWRTIIVVPPARHKTQWSRSLLPQKVPFADAVFNLQRASLLLTAIVLSDEEALKEALVDKLHEPYRARHVPHFLELRQLLAHEPVLGCVLSGAGPSVLVVVHDREYAQILQLLHKWAQEQTANYQVFAPSVDRDGLLVQSL